MLPKAKIAPAMPPPTAIFAMLICGVRVSSFIAAPSGTILITSLLLRKFTRTPRQKLQKQFESSKGQEFGREETFLAVAWNDNQIENRCSVLGERPRGAATNCSLRIIFSF
jgi:hypothetical protein